MTFNREKLESITKPRSKAAIDRAKQRKENRKWIRKSQQIALAIHYFLRKNGMSQKELAEIMNVTPVYVAKLLKGQENLTLETITKIETAIGESIVSVARPYEGVMLVSMPKKQPNVEAKEKSEKYVNKCAPGNGYSSFQFSQNIA